MGMTRYTAAERRRKRPERAERSLETVALAVALVLVLVGMVKVYRAVGEGFEEVGARLESGEILNLNEMVGGDELLPLLQRWAPGEARFIADRIWDRLSQPDAPALPNVGSLAKLRVTRAAVEDEGDGLAGLRRRLEATSQDSVPLLTGGELRLLKPSLVVRRPAGFRLGFWLYGGCMVLGFVAVHLIWRLARFRGDQLILPILAVLTSIGFMLMVSIRDPLRDRADFAGFAQGVIAGCVLLLPVVWVGFGDRRWRRWSFAFLTGAVVLSVLLIAFGTGPGRSDAKVNLFGFQPVEAVKLLVVLFLAGYLCDRWEFLRELDEGRLRSVGLMRYLKMPKLEYVVPVVASMGLVLVFFFLQKDLGPALILALLFLLLYGIARSRVGLLLLGFFIVFSGFYVGYLLEFPRTVAARVAMWLRPWDNGVAGGDQLAESLWTLATGGLTGIGLGRGQSEFVPAIHTDMILAAVGEELGFLGFLLVMGFYLVLLWRGFAIALAAENTFSFFLAVGLSLLIGLQAALIAGGVTGFIPLSGIATPFLSYGRSSMLANFIAIGSILAISGRRRGDSTAGGFRVQLAWTAALLVLLLLGPLVMAARVQLFRSDGVLVQGTLTPHADGLLRYRYNPRLLAITRRIPRGSIVDRNGIPLASGDPQELEERRALYESLGVFLDPDELAAGGRIYPFGGVIFHLLGDLRSEVNWGASNTSFAERDSRARLQGFDDFPRVEEIRQPGGRVTRELRRDYRELIPLLRHPHRGDHPEVQRLLERDRTLRMALDVHFQLRVAAILEQRVRGAGCERGAAVVLDARSGDLLASVSYPWPDESPPTWSNSSGEQLLDRARYGIYPPGSAFKVVSALAALRRNPNLAGETFSCRSLGSGRVGNYVRGWGRPIRDDPTVRVAHGAVSLRKGIEKSCNAYFAQLVTYRVGAGDLLETAAALGIAVARPNTPEQLRDALPQAAIGQGQVIATPFEMARVAATVANGGSMPQGRWVIDAGNERDDPPKPIVTPELAGSIGEAMRRVVTSGTAKSLRSVLPPIAGKTGTAEVADRPSHSWFIGYAPYGAGSGRTIAFSVIIEHGGYGSRQAARAAAEIVEQAAASGLIGQT